MYRLGRLNRSRTVPTSVICPRLKPGQRARPRSATTLHMISIGIRELRQRASEYLRRVLAGETVQVTDRGRPVARIVPIRKTPYEQMLEEGLIRPAKADLLELGAPLPLPDGAIPPSELVSRNREE